MEAAQNINVNERHEAVTLNINSVGCPVCRKEYNEALKAYLKSRLPEMCPTCNARFEKNPLRILDCKEEGCKKITANAPKIIDYLCEDCKKHFEGLQETLKVYGVKEYKINPFIVRGLDYYNRTVFEFVADSEKSQGTVCGGGRYDRLVEDVGGKPEPAVGFGMGIERLLNIMEAEAIEINSEPPLDVYIIRVGGGEVSKAVNKLAEELRAESISVDIDHMDRNIGKQFKAADNSKARFAITVGADEIANYAVKIKDLQTGNEESVKFDKIAKYVKKFTGGI